MTTPIVTPDVYFDGIDGDTPVDAEGLNHIWAALMQALVDQLIPRTVSQDASIEMRDMLLVDASNGDVHLQAPQALSIGDWGARKIDSTPNKVYITAVGSDVLDEHNRTSWTLASPDDDAIFSYAGPGRYVLWRQRTATPLATASAPGLVQISGDLAGTATHITVPGKENVGVALALVGAHTIAADPHGDRNWAQQNAAAQILSHAQAIDPHGDRAYTASSFVPLSWFDGNGQLLPSHTGSLSIINTNVVSSQAAMLALSAQTGDIAIRTDAASAGGQRSYILQGSDPTQFSNWTVMPSIGAVSSVRGTADGTGMTGDVILSYSDVGAASTNDARITGAQQASAKNQANGYAGLGATGLLAAAQLPGATSSTYGGIKLTGGLGGTPDSPTIVGKENTGVAASLVSSHVTATDPHGDRAYASGLLSGIHQPPAGGAAGFALVKNTPTDFDYSWAAVGVTTNVQTDLKIVSVKSYGAVGDGTTDDTAKIQQAVAATPAGGVCWLPPGNYGITAPIIVPPNVTLEGSHTETLTYVVAQPNTSPPMPCTLKVLPAFVGPAAVQVVDRTTGGYSYTSQGQRIRTLTVDMTAAPANTKGVQVYGFCREVSLDRVTVRKATGSGFDFAVNPNNTTEQGSAPQSNRVYGCVADACGGAGFSFVNCPDTTVVDCNAQGSQWHNFYIAGMPNSTFIACRAEWSQTACGFYITSGYWGTGQGSGGFTMNGCLTDRNQQDGIRVDATGSSSILINSQIARRDGRNSGGGGGNYASVNVVGPTANGLTLMPVMIESIIVYPGQDDANNATNGPGGTPVVFSPQFGVRAQNATHVAVAGASYIHAFQAPFSDAGGNSVFYRANALGTATGPTTAPVRVPPASATGAPENINVVAASGAAQTIPDITVATINDITLTANCTFTFPQAANGKSFTLILRQDATGGRTVTWPAVLWPGATLPTRTSAANGVDILTFMSVGGSWAGSMGIKDVR